MVISVARATEVQRRCQNLSVQDFPQAELTPQRFGRGVFAAHAETNPSRSNWGFFCYKILSVQRELEPSHLIRKKNLQFPTRASI